MTVTKKRLHEVAKDLGLDTKVVLDRCKKIGIPVKSHASTLGSVEIERLRLAFGVSRSYTPPPGARKVEAMPTAKPLPPPRPEPVRGEAPRPAPVPPRPAPPPRPSVVPVNPNAAPSEGGVTVHVIDQRSEGGAERRHVKLEKIPRRGRRPGFPGMRPRGPGSPGLGARPGSPAAAPAPRRTVEVQLPVTVKSLSGILGVKVGDLLKHMLDLGVLVTINHALGDEVVALLGEKLSIDLKVIAADDPGEKSIAEVADKPEDLVACPPIVTMMGHVDHGKTSLLDRIRRTNVAAKESGGITQHIGAYRVVQGDKTVVFLDTPGHAAFTEMRARGANMTDIVVLVVAADEGVMPQTEEALNHARAAEVPIVVALNKMDKPQANPMKVKQQLAGVGLQTEEWGGKTVVVEVSAQTGAGIDKLIEMLALEAELLDLKANPNKPARGVVIESSLSGERGVVTHVLLREGTLKKGDVVLAGSCYGRVRGLNDDQGKPIPKAGPKMPVEILGFEDPPEAGDAFYVMEDMDAAKDLAGERAAATREKDLVRRQHVTLENLFGQTEKEGLHDLNVILKGDVQGSLEAIEKAISDLSTPEVKVRVLHRGVGTVTESDVLLADASDAIIMGFHVVPEERARSLAQEKGVEIRRYQIIYQIVDDVKKALEGMLAPEAQEVSLGLVSVRKTFHASKVGTIAGCMVSKGVVRRDARLRLIRDGVVVHEGTVGSLKRFKDDASEVKEGTECGIKIEGYDDVKEGDVIESFKIDMVARTLDVAPKSPTQSKK
ncbi:MAG: translation initiation factor IF-2 [Planctomycetes bacterium]|nr:translation initiation factor IF-2 [Planctomycetota bacterium]